MYQATIEQPAPQPNHIDISQVDYAFFGFILLLSTGIIGWFIRSAFKGLTESNTQLKNSIERLAEVASSIHTDLYEFKATVAAEYATKEDLLGLKDDINRSCVLRHSRRKDDNPGE